MLSTNCAQIDRPVSPGAGVLDRDGGSPADLAEAVFSLKDSGSVFFAQKAFPERATRAEEMPESLAEGDLAVSVVDGVVLQSGSDLAYKGGLLSAAFAAIGGFGVGDGRPAVRAGERVRGNWLRGFDAGGNLVDQNC